MMKNFNKWVSNGIRRARGDLSTPWRRAVGWFEFYFVDHAFFRTVYLNKHYVTPDLIRTAQPSPRHLRKLAKEGLKTVINLRGERDCTSYLREKAVCEELGLTLVDFEIRSRDIPRPRQIHAAKALFETMETPALIHCKSGADRAGFMAALYVLLHENRPVDEALKQLSPKYGHVRQGKTGILDHFFEQYEAHRQATGEDFMTWVDGDFNAKAMRLDFHANWWGNLIVDRILGRE